MSVGSDTFGPLGRVFRPRRCINKLDLNANYFLNDDFLFLPYGSVVIKEVCQMVGHQILP